MNSTPVILGLQRVPAWRAHRSRGDAGSRGGAMIRVLPITSILGPKIAGRAGLKGSLK